MPEFPRYLRLLASCCGTISQSMLQVKALRFVALHKVDGWGVCFATMYCIHKCSKCNDPDPYERSPVRRCCINRKCEWKAAKNDDEQTIEDSKCVDHQSEATKAPLGKW